MANPIAGQTYTIAFTSTDEDLTGATITIEKEEPNGQITTGIVPTSVDLNSNPKVVTLLLTPEMTANDGLYNFRVKIITADLREYYSTNDITIKFEPKF